MNTIQEWFTKIGLMLLLVLTPVHSIMIAVSCLVAFDFITGVWAAKKRGEKLTSSGYRRSITKGLIYQIAIVFAMIVEIYLIPNWPVINVISAAIGFTECKSFFENVHSITGVDYWKLIIQKLNGSPQEYIEKLIDKKTEK